MANLWKKYGGNLKWRDAAGKMQARRTALGAWLWFFIMLVLAVDFSMEKVDFEPGQVSDRDIVSPRTVSYVDELRTQKLKDDMLASIVDVYDIDVGVLERKEDYLEQVFDGILASAALKKEEKEARLRDVNRLSLSDETISALAALSGEDVQQLRTWTLGMLKRYLQRGIKPEELEAARRQAGIEIDEFAFNEERKTLLKALVLPLLEPNVVPNPKETEKRRQSAVNSVEPVREVVRKGQVVVRRGDVINESQIQIMRELGIHVGQSGLYQKFALGVFVLAVLIIAGMFLRKFEQKLYNNLTLLFLLGMILFFSLCVAKVANYYSFFIGPVATGPLLAAILLSPRVGLLLNIALGIFCGAIASSPFPAALVTLLGGSVGVYSVAKKAHGYSFTRSGILIALVNCVVLWAVYSSFNMPPAQPLWLECVLSVVSGIGAAVITTGLLPYLETVFQITTPLKLLELAQPNQPLLQRLLLEAPGTYHHSILIGNLAEAAADVIGADPILVRVGAYYHDVGKIKRPYFFVENQFGADNPHEKLAPTLSALTIISHVKDGIELCREYNVPKVIEDIVAQHHGTLLVGFFYQKALKGAHGECVNEADFRYEGPKPQRKEAALIMIADACEAAVRSINKPNINRIETMVRKIIKDRLYDGQFDECNLTLKHLDAIGSVYIRILSSMFHSRIEYPEAVKKKEGKQKQNGNHSEPSAGGGSRV